MSLLRFLRQMVIVSRAQDATRARTFPILPPPCFVSHPSFFFPLSDTKTKGLPPPFSWSSTLHPLVINVILYAVDKARTENQGQKKRMVRRNLGPLTFRPYYGAGLFLTVPHRLYIDWTDGEFPGRVVCRRDKKDS